MPKIRARRMLFSLLLAAVLAAIGAVVVPMDALAYIEGSISGRIASPTNSGCIWLESSLSHGGGSDPLSIHALARTEGFTGTPNPAFQGGMVCVSAPWHGKAIKGQLQGAVLKLRQAALPGGSKDQYDFCRIHAAYTPNFGSNITLAVSYPTPPCGPGYYALAACLYNTTTQLWDELGSVQGTFSTGTVKRDCNISPHWHPATGNGTGMGTQVKY